MFYQKLKIAMGLACAALLLAALTGLTAYRTSAAESGAPSAPPPPPAGAKGPPAAQSEIAAANNAFACEIYRTLVKGDANLFISPYSIHSALAMTQEGARGNTRLEMQKTLHLPANPCGATYAALNKQLAGDGKSYELSVVNALWGEKTYKFLDPFLAQLRTDYGAGLTPLDFMNDPDVSRRTINAAIEKQTRDRIKDLLQPEHIKSDTRLVLTNAIYFKGAWESEFKGRDTRDWNFTTFDGGGKVKVSMMGQKNEFAYTEDDAVQVLQMPYVGQELAMVVILPKGKDAAALAKLEEQLTEKRLAGWMAGLKAEQVNVRLPKFRLEGKFDLIPPLQSLGIREAFDMKSADFSGMDGTYNLYVSVVVHKTFVEVAEKGTEAAAATAVVLVPKSAPPQGPRPKEFIADHPFVFGIRDLRSGALLFLGRLTKPEPSKAR
jgi:serpin B